MYPPSLNRKQVATQSTTQEDSVCECCGSSDFTASEFGKICKACGVIKEQLSMVYNTPYRENAVQHAPMSGFTKIGTLYEQLANQNSSKIRSLKKTNLRYNRPDHQLEIGRVEISRLFHILQLPHRLKRETFQSYCEVRNRLTPGTKYRSPAGLSAVVVYTMMKLRKISIDQIAILEVSHLSRKEFNEFKLKVCPLFRDYAKRDRKAYVSQKLLQISEQFELGMKFYFRSKKILDGLWSQINNTTDEAVAGLTASLCLLTQQSKHVTVTSICNQLGIMPSTVHFQVRKQIIDRYQVQGYKSLLRSRELITTALSKLGLVEVS